MLEKAFAPVLRFFGIIASSLTGITAVFTAVGFLAERSHLQMLGFTSIPVDINQYLFTGARFFAYLPFTLINALGLGSLALLRKYIVGFVAALALLILFRLLLKISIIQRLFKKLVDILKKIVRRHRTGFLFLLMIFQFAGIFLLITTSQIKNLLFRKDVSEVVTSTLSFANTQILSSWIIHKKQNLLTQHMGLLLFITLITALILWQVIATYRKSDIAKQSLWEKIWLGVNLLLMGTQLILIPMNHGILLLPNSYPMVSVTFVETTDENLNQLQNEQLFLLHHQDKTFYLYSHKAAKVWYIQSQHFKSLVYLGMGDIFESNENSDP